MAKYNPARRGLDEQELEGGGSGAGMRNASIKDTKWSKMPSFNSNASLMDDIRKMGKDTSHLKGNAKKVSEDAKDRAVVRTGVRAAATGATAAGIKAAVSDDSEDTTDNTPSRAGMGEIMSGKGMAKGGMTEDLEKNKEAPKDIDDASAGRKFKKDEPGMPEQPGRDIRVDGKKVKGMAKGGSASNRGDGIAQRGKTKGTMVMCGGGMSRGKR